MSQPESPGGDVLGDEETRSMLHTITQETRFTLLQNIIAHPHQMPSLAELEHINPSKARTTIVEHLEALIGAGVVERIEYDPNKSENDIPHVFYGLSDKGRELLEDHRLFQAEETLQQIYDRTDKPETIRRYEDAPRPDR